MNYQKFKDTIISRLVDFYGTDAALSVVPILKNNKSRYEGIQISFPNKKNEVIPLIQLEKLYERYLNGEITIAECTGAVVEMREDCECEETLKEFTENCMEWDIAKDKVYPILLGTETNKEMLENLVHMPYLDMSIAYIIRNSLCRCSCNSIKVTHSLMKYYGINYEQLHQQAMKNMENDDYKFTDLEYTIWGMVMQAGGLEDNKEYPAEPKLQKNRWYIMSNSSLMYGAAGILNKKFLEEVVGNNDCYILPSSLHEAIFVPADDKIKQEDLDKKVAEVNRGQVPPEDVLVNHSYFYDGSTHEIRICK